MSLQLGNFNPDGSQNTHRSPAGNNVPNLVQMVVLNYMALHSATIWRVADACGRPSEHRTTRSARAPPSIR